MTRRRAGGVVTALLGAVMLGVGTLFQMKARADDHWSTSPKLAVIEDAEAADSGEPVEPSH
ncbi:MAG: hypothetical protein ACXW1S_07685 [Acidimicrobiia bacterium]